MKIVGDAQGPASGDDIVLEGPGQDGPGNAVSGPMGRLGRRCCWACSLGAVPLTTAPHAAFAKSSGRQQQQEAKLVCSKAMWSPKQGPGGYCRKPPRRPRQPLFAAGPGWHLSWTGSTLI